MSTKSIKIRSNTFCCCLPVRFGVFVMSTLGLIMGLFVMIAGIAKVSDTEGDKVSLDVQIVSYAFMACFSGFGLYGAISRRSGFIGFFFWSLIFHVFFNIIAGIYTLAILFKNGPSDVQTCIDSAHATGDYVVSGCKNSVAVFKNVAVVMFIIIWLVEMYACIIVRSYRNQLEDEEIANFRHLRAAEAGNAQGYPRRVPPMYQPPKTPLSVYVAPSVANGRVEVDEGGKGRYS